MSFYFPLHLDGGFRVAGAPAALVVLDAGNQAVGIGERAVAVTLVVVAALLIHGKIVPRVGVVYQIHCILQAHLQSKRWVPLVERSTLFFFVVVVCAHTHSHSFRVSNREAERVGVVGSPLVERQLKRPGLGAGLAHGLVALGVGVAVDIVGLDGVAALGHGALESRR